jgi:putative membrane protein insertion efficiency factor
VKKALSAVVRIPTLLLTALVVGYRRFVSPLMGPSCRFYPTCSTYALEALRVHGAVKGTALTTARLCRCHPWNPGGVDHVPPKGAWRPEPYIPLTSFDDVPRATGAAEAGSSPADPAEPAGAAPADRSVSWT